MDFVAGAIGGGVSAAVGYPLDTVKVRIQTEAQYRGIWHCMRDIYRTERVPGCITGAIRVVLISPAEIAKVYTKDLWLCWAGIVIHVECIFSPTLSCVTGLLQLVKTNQTCGLCFYLGAVLVFLPGVQQPQWMSLRPECKQMVMDSINILD
ncbi:solute carrier family 25 member 47 [Crotalus adamanteus]|uniref:Solute carrier family 25 member 47 n=1 Tax=Crotalus adamanteus TaxID=8729 RepID=A0AAW1C7B9_CROAD